MLPAQSIFIDNNENSNLVRALKANEGPDEGRQILKTEKTPKRRALSSLSTSQINIRSNHNTSSSNNNTTSDSKSMLKNISILGEPSIPNKKNPRKFSEQRSLLREEEESQAKLTLEPSEMTSSTDSSKWLTEDPYDEVVRKSKEIDHFLLPNSIDFPFASSNEELPNFEFSWETVESTLQIQKVEAQLSVATTYITEDFPLFSLPMDD